MSGFLWIPPSARAAGRRGCVLVAIRDTVRARGSRSAIGASAYRRHRRHVRTVLARLCMSSARRELAGVAVPVFPPLSGFHECLDSWVSEFLRGSTIWPFEGLSIPLTLQEL